MRLAFWRGLLWFGALLMFLLVAAGVSAAAWMPQNLRLKDRMNRFCATFRVGSPISAAEIARRAQEQDYKTVGPLAVPVRPGEAPVTSMLVYQLSWTGTRWSCTVQLQDDRAVAVKFSTRSLVD